METDPLLVFESTVSKYELGRGIAQALTESGKTVPQPRWNEFNSPLHQVTGVETWNQFVGGTKASAVDLALLA